ncbi:cell division protein kinase 2 homolog CRK1-like [Paramacrobiotus metropolitanus]|uniref:cell division protein kinase 2 homolog CRK1-like n=1 Tax=Paramacrobiotus metropolitanus TaxID=2943436 RepID=UPI0024462C3C|nr:cell division protein kinase 2 homolog CRK1-like [Paramacrobiotus metropolitanus]
MSILDTETAVFCNDLKYKKREFIGKGTYGIVYKVTIEKTRAFRGATTIAAKICKLSDQSAEETEQEIRARLNKLTTLRHRNVLEYYRYEITEANGLPALEIIMEWCSGDLGKYMTDAQQKKLNWTTVVRFGIDMAEGLGFLFDQCIIHGDLKPSNIFVKISQWNQQHLVIGDLDDYVLMHGDTTVSQDVRNLRGTPRYMSPEIVKKFIAQNTARPGRKSDIWSFGCIMVDLVNGRVGYKEKWLQNGNDRVRFNAALTEHQYVRYIVNGYAPEIIDTIRADISACIRQCLHTDDVRRISGKELSKQMRKLQTWREVLGEHKVLVRNVSGVLYQRHRSRLVILAFVIVGILWIIAFVHSCYQNNPSKKVVWHYNIV